MVLEKVKPSWFVIAVAVLVAAGAVAHWKVVDGRRAELAAVEVRLHDAEQANGALDHLTAQLPQLRRDVETFAKAVPPNADLGPLMEAMGDALNSDGVAEREVLTKPTVAGQPVARVPFSLQYRGSFNGTVALLKRMQEGHRLTRVDRVLMERTSAGDVMTPLRVEIEFSTFSRTTQELESWANAE